MVMFMAGSMHKMEKLQVCVPTTGSGLCRLSPLHITQATTGVMMAQETSSNTHSTVSYNKEIAQFKGPVKESDLDAVRAALANPAPSQPLKHGWEIPIIDFAQFHCGHRRAIVGQIGRACQEWGFFHVINHYVPNKVLDDMWEAYRFLFPVSKDERGKFDCGPFIPPDILKKLNEKKEALQKYADWRDTIRLRDLNPDDDEGVISLVPQPFRALRDVGLDVLHAISESLGVEPDHIHNVTGKNVAINSSLHFYSPNVDGEKTMGLNPHKDILTLTVLVQDDTGGLQVLKEDRWVDAKPLPNSLIVNVGESIQAITNGNYKSVLHRVVNHHEKTRSSISCFLVPTPYSVIKPLPHLVDEANPALYPTSTWASFVHNHYALALKF